MLTMNSLTMKPSRTPSLLLLCFVLVAFLSACALNDIATPTPNLLLSTPLGYPGRLVVRNADWHFVLQKFGGVDMVLVPAGCFNMGINPGNAGDSDELPASTQCFANPFWMDRTEVTNAEFAQFNGIAKLESTWTDPNRPRVNIRWQEAVDFCQRRNMRLPTEREWEYAARGPDGLIYPWGNKWEPDYLVNPANANAQTVDVGSYPVGISWVGALDLLGNVWEWTSTIYDNFPYPYTLDDNRDILTDLTSQRVIRGASWYEASDYYARSSNRGRLSVSIQDFNIGFRCVRDY